MTTRRRFRRAFGGEGYAVGHNFGKPRKQVCQRCAHEFESKRLVPYCPPCYQAKRKERAANATPRAAS